HPVLHLHQLWWLNPTRVTTARWQLTLSQHVDVVPGLLAGDAVTLTVEDTIGDVVLLLEVSQRGMRLRTEREPRQIIDAVAAFVAQDILKVANPRTVVQTHRLTNDRSAARGHNLSSLPLQRSPHRSVHFVIPRGIGATVYRWGISLEGLQRRDSLGADR